MNISYRPWAWLPSWWRCTAFWTSRMPPLPPPGTHLNWSRYWRLEITFCVQRFRIGEIGIATAISGKSWRVFSTGFQACPATCVVELINKCSFWLSSHLSFKISSAFRFVWFREVTLTSTFYLSSDSFEHKVTHHRVKGWRWATSA